MADRHLLEDNPVYDNIHFVKADLEKALKDAFIQHLPRLREHALPMPNIVETVTEAAVAIMAMAILSEKVTYVASTQWAKRIGENIRERLLFHFGYHEGLRSAKRQQKIDAPPKDKPRHDEDARAKTRKHHDTDRESKPKINTLFFPSCDDLQMWIITEQRRGTYKRPTLTPDQVPFLQKSGEYASGPVTPIEIAWIFDLLEGPPASP